MQTRIGVSTTTIIRFSRALGYTRYQKCKRIFKTDSRQKSAFLNDYHTHKDYPSNTLLADSFQNDIQNIQSTLEAQNVEDLQKAIDLISTAPTVYVLGMRSSFSISYYTASRLSEIRENIHLIQSVGMLYPEEMVTQSQEMSALLIYLDPQS